MGCWNGTCGVTQLPIKWGDPARVFLLVPNPFKEFKNSFDKMGAYLDKGDAITGYGGFCDSTEFFSPLALSVKGSYCDYGSLENIEENQDNKILVEWFNDNHSKIIVKKDEHYEKEAKDKKGKYTLEGILTLVERKLTVLSFMMVHEFAYQSLLSNLSAYIDDSFFLREEIDRNQKENKGFLNLISDYQVRSKNKNNSRNLCWDRGYGEREHNIHRDLNNMYIDVILKDKKIDKFLNSFAEHRCFCDNFDLSRKTWFPQNGAGSQSSALLASKKLFEDSITFINEKIKKYNEEGDCEYEDD